MSSANRVVPQLLQPDLERGGRGEEHCRACRLSTKVTISAPSAKQRVTLDIFDATSKTPDADLNSR